MATWEEVRKLAADFQRIQNTSTAHKLSERSCIEIVAKLIEMKLLDVIYTLDGKEYVTSQYLEREIMDELHVHRGRINVVDLRHILNVDLHHVETKVEGLLKHDDSLVFIQGDLIKISYLDQLAEEVNDTLQESGQVVIAELSQNFGLPLKFLMENLQSRLGSIIHGQFDAASGMLYTNAYVARHRSRVRGIFSAATRPTPVSHILSQGGFHSSLFHSVLRELIAAGELKGTLHGRLENAKFIPDVYSVMQKKWVDSFFTSNSYLEFDALKRLGIDDPVLYIKNQFGKSDVTILESCCIGYSIKAQIMTAIEEAKTSHSWVDVLPLLPSPCVIADAEVFLSKCTPGDVLKYSSIATCKEFMQSCLALFTDMMETKAQQDISKNPSLLSELSSPQKGSDKRDKKRNARQADRKTAEIKFLDIPKIINVLEEKMPEWPTEFVEAIAQDMQRPLTEEYCKVLESSFDLMKKPSGIQHRKLHATLETQVQEVWTQLKLCEKALPYFEGESRVQGHRYLLSTLCTDLVTKVVRFVAEDHMIPVEIQEVTLTSEERVKIINQLPPAILKHLKSLETSLHGKDVDTFSQKFEMICGMDFCGVLLKKVDKKKERHLLFTHRQSLLSKVEHEEDPAMALHLVTVVLFQQHTGCMLHAPGRMVPSIVAILEKYLPEEEQKILLSFQQLIIKYITALRNQEETKSSLNNWAHKSNTSNEVDDADETKDKEEGQENEHVESAAAAEQMDDDPAMLLSKLNSDLPLVKGVVLKPKKDQ